MAELDLEVINALEPQDRLDLCPVTAVLGMTRTGFERLRPNQTQRIQVKVRVGDDANRDWADNAADLASFAARYMNAVRLPDSTPSALTKQWKDLLEDLRHTLPELREFLGDELAVPQGRSRNVIFIDSRPILAAAMDFRKKFGVDRLSDEYMQSFWKSRYSLLQKTETYSAIEVALSREREALGRELAKVTSFLDEYGYDSTNITDAWSAFCLDLAEVRAIEKQNMPIYAQDFAALYDRGTFRDNAAVWGRSLQQAQQVVTTDDPVEVVVFAPDVLLKSLLQSRKHVRIY